MKDRTNQPRSKLSIAQLRSVASSAVLAGSLLLTISAAASNSPASQSSIKRISISTYCSEAQSKSSSLANGSVSYKRVADLASERALQEHPNIYPDSSAWKGKIAALLDQYGDEPTSELCTENPDRRHDVLAGY
jgi:hypothetical protein